MAAHAQLHTREKLLTRHIRELRHEDFDFDNQFKRAVRDGIFFETVHRRKDGTVFPVGVAWRPTEVGGVRTEPRAPGCCRALRV